MAGNKIGFDEIFSSEFFKNIEKAQSALDQFSEKGVEDFSKLYEQAQKFNLGDPKQTKEFIDVFQNASKVIKDYTAAQKALETLNQQQIKTQRDQIKLSKDQENQQKLSNKAIKENELAQEGANGAAKRATDRLNDLKKILKDQAFQQTLSNSELAKARKEFEELDKKVRSAEEGVGEFQRRVGQYASGFDKFFSKIPGGQFFKEIKENVGESAEAFIALGEGAEGAALAMGGLAIGGLTLAAKALLETESGVKGLNTVIHVTEGILRGFGQLLIGGGFENFKKIIEAEYDIAQLENQELEKQIALRKGLAQLIQGQAQAVAVVSDNTKNLTDRIIAQKEATEASIKAAQLNLDIEINHKKEAAEAEKSAQGIADKRKAQLALAEAEAKVEQSLADITTLKLQNELAVYNLTKEKIESENLLFITQKNNAAQLAEFFTNPNFSPEIRIAASNKAFAAKQEVYNREIQIAKQEIELTQARVNESEIITQAKTKQKEELDQQIKEKQKQLDEFTSDILPIQLGGSVKKLREAGQPLSDQDIKAYQDTDPGIGAEKTQRLNELNELRKQALKLGEDIDTTQVKVSGISTANEQAKAKLNTEQTQQKLSVEQHQLQLFEIARSEFQLEVAIVKELGIYKKKALDDEFNEKKRSFDSKRDILLQEQKLTENSIAAIQIKFKEVFDQLPEDAKKGLKDLNFSQILAEKDPAKREQLLQNLGGSTKQLRQIVSLLGEIETQQNDILTKNKKLTEEQLELEEKFRANLEKRKAEDLGFGVKSSIDPIQAERHKLEALEKVRHDARVKEIDDTAEKLGDIQLIQDAADEEAKRHFLELQKIKEDAGRKEVEQVLKTSEEISAGVEHELESRNSVENDASQQRIDYSEHEIDRETTLAAAGRDNDLANQKANLAKEQEARKEALEKQRKQQEEVELARLLLADVNSHISKGEDYGIALAKSLVETFSTKAAIATIVSGFADGGYTGDGGKYDAAGIVHKGEFVHTQEDTSTYRPLFEAIHAGTFDPFQMDKYLPDYMLTLPSRSTGENMGSSALLHIEIQNQKLLQKLVDKPVYLGEKTVNGGVQDIYYEKGNTIAVNRR